MNECAKISGRYEQNKVVALACEFRERSHVLPPPRLLRHVGRGERGALRADPVKWTPANPVTAAWNGLEWHGKTRERGRQKASDSSRRWAGPGRRGSV